MSLPQLPDWAGKVQELHYLELSLMHMLLDTKNLPAPVQAIYMHGEGWASLRSNFTQSEGADNCAAVN